MNEDTLHDLRRLLEDGEDWTVTKVIRLIESGVLRPDEARRLLGLERKKDQEKGGDQR